MLQPKRLQLLLSRVHNARQARNLAGVLAFAVLSASAAVLGPSLSATLPGLADTANVGTVIVAFNTTTGLNASHLAVLQAAGISRGYTLQNLGMVGTPATAGQVRALAANAAVRSIWLNDQLHYLNNQTRVLTGVDKMRTDANFIRANGGVPVRGKGNISLVGYHSTRDAPHSRT